MADLCIENTLRLLVFTKAPTLGSVKTRLQPDLTQKQSLALHVKLVEHCLSTVTAASVAAVELWVSDDHAWWHELKTQYPISIFRQQGADLGERMLFAAMDALTRGDRVVIIGTDCPYIDADYLHSAFNCLYQGNDIVLGPALDGGYVLVGLNVVHSAIFERISWGSDQVLNQTREQLQALSMVWHELPTLRDIDRPEDVIDLESTFPALTSHADKVLVS
jgi:uncharacterized protein